MHQANDTALSCSLRQGASAIAAVIALCPIALRSKAAKRVNLLRLKHIRLRLPLESK
jgi:hypothetical protein